MNAPVRRSFRSPHFSSKVNRPKRLRFARHAQTVRQDATSTPRCRRSRRGSTVVCANVIRAGDTSANPPFGVCRSTRIYCRARLAIWRAGSVGSAAHARLAVAHVVTERANGLITSQRGDCRSSRTYCLAHHDIRRAGNVKLVQSLARSKQDFNNALGLLVPRKRSGQCAKCTARRQRSRRRLVNSYANATTTRNDPALPIESIVAFASLQRAGGFHGSLIAAYQPSRPSRSDRHVIRRAVGN